MFERENKAFRPCQPTSHIIIYSIIFGGYVDTIFIKNHNGRTARAHDIT